MMVQATRRQPGFEDDLELLISAAREAGALAMRYWNRPLRSERKPDGTMVTEADFAVDALLTEMLRGARPDYGWLSEESADGPERLDVRRIWMLDPIDGTRAFMKTGDDWTIAISLVENGAPILSVIFNPVRDELFTAQRGAGATLNGETIRVGDAETLEGVRLLA